MAKWSNKLVLAYYDAFPETTLGRFSKISNREISDLINLLSIYRS